METVTTRTSNAFSDRIKLPLNFNTAKMNA